MTVLRNVEADLARFRTRIFVISLVVLVCFLLLIARLASDNLNAAQRMQLEVVELLALIRLDLHQIWDFDE